MGERRSFVVEVQSVRVRLCKFLNIRLHLYKHQVGTEETLHFQQCVLYTCGCGDEYPASAVRLLVYLKNKKRIGLGGC